MKKVLKIILALLLAIVIAAALFIGFLTVTEYRPADVEPASLRSAEVTGTVSRGDMLKIISWNIGYSGLGKDSDFLMDGGGKVPVADEAKVQEYFRGINATLDSADADIRMLQEVDRDSSRSYNFDMRDSLTIGSDAYAPNHLCSFVPFPWPPFGKTDAGVFTTTGLEISSAKRIALPCPFSWPLRTANLKRCLLASYIPVEGTEKYLVIVNHHLEAYDSGEGRIAQTRILIDFLQDEYDKGNWVIAGGDWNQVFPGTLEQYPNTHQDLWTVGSLDEDFLPEGWSFVFDSSVPTCRLLNQPYDPSDTVNTQYYVIDGFLVSPNVGISSVETLDKDFENSDHNPVTVEVTLN